MALGTSVLEAPKLRTNRDLRRQARQHQRQRLVRDAWVVMLRPNLPWQKINTRNISPAGIGFVSGNAMRVGERFALRLRADADTGKLFLCRVKFGQTMEDGTFLAGASFEASLPDAAATIPTAWLQDN